MQNVWSRLFGGKSAEPTWVEVGGLRERMGSAAPPLILDVRGIDEFDGPLGHIEGARNIPLPALAAQIEELARSTAPIVCVCLTDKRSSQAAADLTAAGAADVSVLRGGMKAWREAGL
jgi:rhodanese-related sulfurtransferase